MLEILLVVYLGKKMAALMRQKGRSPTGYVFMLVGMWLGGEILGMVLGMMLMGAADGPNLSIYGLAIVGAVIGAGLAFLIAKSLAPVGPAFQPGFPVMPYGAPGMPYGTPGMPYGGQPPMVPTPPPAGPRPGAGM